MLAPVTVLDVHWLSIKLTDNRGGHSVLTDNQRRDSSVATVRLMACVLTWLYKPFTGPGSFDTNAYCQLSRGENPSADVSIHS
jgi:hypothetical protein